MRVIGLTGGIASGKSTVSAMLRELGAPVIDADQLAREVVQPGTPGLADVAARFPGVLTAQGTLDRAALGARVFADPGERAALNALLHPRVHALYAQRVAELAAQGHGLAIYDVPLLFENGLEKTLGGTVLVSVPPEVQRARLVARDGLTPAQADARIAAQLPLAEKAAKATWIVDNSGDLAATRSQVHALWKTLREGAGNVL